LYLSQKNYIENVLHHFNMNNVKHVSAWDGSWSRLCFIWLCLTAKPSHMEADVDELAYCLHRPMVCDWQMWVQCFLIGDDLSRHVAVVSGVFLVCAKPLVLDIYRGIDCPGP
jgi:hypothetical protein